MDIAARLVAGWVAIAFLLAGPLAPASRAQQPPPTSAPAPSTTPPAPPAVSAQPAPPPVPSQPELFQETLRSPRDDQPEFAYEAGAAAINVVRLPGKAVLCTLGGVVGLVVLALTFGNAYKTAAASVQEGCGGKWLLTADDLRPEKLARDP